jgi:hypothetical protein
VGPPALAIVRLERPLHGRLPLRPEGEAPMAPPLLRRNP